MTLPAGWAQRALGEVSEVTLGKTRSPKSHSGPNMIPYLRAANVTWRGLDLSDVNEMHFTPDEVAKYRLEPGDVLLNEGSGSASEVGKPVTWNGELPLCGFQNTLLRVRTKGPEPPFLRYYFLHAALSGALASVSTGVGINHLGRRNMLEFPVLLPPPPEQRRIVEAIEEQFSRLDAAEDTLLRVCDRLDAYESAALLQIFAGAWEMGSLGDLTETITKGTNPTSVGFKFVDQGILFVKAESLAQGRIDSSRCAHISPEAHEALAPSSFRVMSSSRLRGPWAVWVWCATLTRQPTPTRQSLSCVFETPDSRHSSRHGWRVPSHRAGSAQMDEE